VREVATPLGPAHVHPSEPDGAVRGTLVLGSGAGGGVDAADLVAVAGAGCAAGWRVLRVEQPWRVAGRRIAPAPPRLDEGWTAVLADLRDAGELTGPLVLGGRSAGARVACRTASSAGAAGVLALAFPLHPPGRPEKSRAAELALAGVPLLVVQGATDAFGRPAEVEAVLPTGGRVQAVAGDHSLTRDVTAVATAAATWLGTL
jgi:predicted alpha/beta-hydrolase family hydrolase